MQWRNSSRRYGLVSILLHWGGALMVFGLFGLGLWMTGLEFHDSWYQRAPQLHLGLGVLLLLAMLLRLLWRLASPPPPALGSARQRRAAALVHGLLYLGLFALGLSGYLLVTADGRSLAVFGWFELPALLHGLPGQRGIAAAIHQWLAWGLIGLAGLHALAALRHHWVERDATLRRMFGHEG